MVAAVRCAPPQNKPTTEERDTCAPWLEREITLVAPHVRAVVASARSAGTPRCGRSAPRATTCPRPKPRFGHGAEARAGARAVTLLGCYHPSQQNTFTGKLTEPMLDAVLRRGCAGWRVRRWQDDRRDPPRHHRHRPRPARHHRRDHRVLAGLGLNLEDSTMTLLRGHFAMMLICAGDAAVRRGRGGPGAARPPTAR